MNPSENSLSGAGIAGQLWGRRQQTDPKEDDELKYVKRTDAIICFLPSPHPYVSAPPGPIGGQTLRCNPIISESLPA